MNLRSNDKDQHTAKTNLTANTTRNDTGALYYGSWNMAKCVYFEASSTKLDTGLDGNADSRFSCQQDSRYSTEYVNANVESVLINESVTKPCKTESTSSSNILASGKLFRFLTKATGLWNPRKKYYGLLCFFIAILAILSVLAEILIPSMCGTLADGCVTSGVTNVTRPSRVTNATQVEKNDSATNLNKLHAITEGFGAWNALADTASYIILIYTCWRVQQQLPLLSLHSAETKVTSREWLVINIVLIICSFAIIGVTIYQVSGVGANVRKMYGTYGLGLLIVYIIAFICSSVFAVWTCVLGSLSDLCFQDICSMTEGNVNDITVIHQKLCKQLTNASSLLAPWFVVHWFMFGLYCFAVFVFNTINFSIMSQQFTLENNYFMAVAFALNLTLFVMPCFYASRVTWKCDELLYMVNNMTAGDWNEGHPFRVRANVNEFVFYAERSKCGFKIGSITFGSSATWVSVLLGLLGVGVRFAAYIQL